MVKRLELIVEVDDVCDLNDIALDICDKVIEIKGVSGVAVIYRAKLLALFIKDVKGVV